MITWKSVKKTPPPLHKEKDQFGVSYRSDNLLVWVADTNDGKGAVAHAHAYKLPSTGKIVFSIFGFHGDFTVTHWTEINRPKKSG